MILQTASTEDVKLIVMGAPGSRCTRSTDLRLNHAPRDAGGNVPGVVDPGESGERAVAGLAARRSAKDCHRHSRPVILIGNGAGDNHRRPLWREQRGQQAAE